MQQNLQTKHENHVYYVWRMTEVNLMRKDFKEAHTQ